MQIQIFVIEKHINFPSEKSFFRRLRQLIFFFFQMIFLHHMAAGF